MAEHEDGNLETSGLLNGVFLQQESDWLLVAMQVKASLPRMPGFAGSVWGLPNSG